MASLFSMPRPRGKRNEDNLLGMNGDIGMTDSSFQGMGRAPVDELWAGKYSAAIDDKEFEEASEVARAARDEAIGSKPVHMSGPMFDRGQSEKDWVQNSRDYITDQSGLDLYPGHLQSNVENPIFMREFSDEEAALKEGWYDLLQNPPSSEEPVVMGDIFHHPELYSHYPESQFLPVELGSGMSPLHRGTYYSPREGAPLGKMRLNGLISDDKKNRETILHEMQHFIQRAEGWEGGGSASPQTGQGFVNHIINSSEAHPGEGSNPQANSLMSEINEMYEASDEVMPFMKREEVFSGLADRGYNALSGEQLARDVTNRDEIGSQVVDYYRGATDSWGKWDGDGAKEYENWNHTGASFQPMAVMPQLRQRLADNGLLGPIYQDEDGNPIRMENRDPYVEQYLKEMGSLLSSGGD